MLIDFKVTVSIDNIQDVVASSGYQKEIQIARLRCRYEDNWIPPWVLSIFEVLVHYGTKVLIADDGSGLLQS